MHGFQFKTHYWPILTAVWTLSGFLITYLISVINKHVFAFMPYISDTGTIPPESCFFGQILNMSTCFLAVTIYIRHRQIKFAHETFSLSISPKWNQKLKQIGFTSCFGLSIVANFQETNLNGVVHFIGAFVSFFCMGIYFLLDTRISFEILERQKNPALEYSVSRQLVITRAVLSILMLPLFIINLVTGFVAWAQFEGEDYYYWPPSMKGYALHTISTVTEWLVGFCIFFYILSYKNEFKALNFSEIKMDNKMQ